MCTSREQQHLPHEQMGLTSWEVLHIRAAGYAESLLGVLKPVFVSSYVEDMRDVGQQYYVVVRVVAGLRPFAAFPESFEGEGVVQFGLKVRQSFDDEQHGLERRIFNAAFSVWLYDVHIVPR